MHATAIDATPTGVGLVHVVASVDPVALDPDAQLSYLAACERLAAWVHSLQDAALVAFVGANPRHTLYTVDGDEHALVDARRAEVAAELRWSEQHAHRRITDARALATDLPRTRTALRDGGLGPAAASAVVDGARQLTASIDEAIRAASRDGADGEVCVGLQQARRELLGRYEARVVATACTNTVARCRYQVRRTVASLDPLGWAARRNRAIRELSDVRIDHLDDGMSMLTAVLSSEQAVACMRRIDGLARAARVHAALLPASRRVPIGVRRVDALVALVRGGDGATDAAGDATANGAAGDGATGVAGGAGASGAHGCGAGRPAIRAKVDVVIALPTLLGLDDASAELVGVGPIPADVVRELIAGDLGATLRRIVTDARTGGVLEVGPRRYAIDARTRAVVERRDGHCRFPGCMQPAHRCECDHAQPFDRGGPTVPGNLGLVCKRHHQCKTHGRWRIIDADGSGACTWVSPLGRRYRHAPDALLPEALEFAGV